MPCIAFVFDDIAVMDALWQSGAACVSWCTCGVYMDMGRMGSRGGSLTRWDPILIMDKSW